MPVITSERPDTPDAQALIAELDAQLDPLYPSESRYGYSVEKLLAQGVVFFVLRDGGEPVGCGGLQFFGTEYAELKRMYVRDAHRGRGLAQKMLVHLAAHARSHGVLVLRLETGIHQHAAIALYERAGFTRIPRFGDYRPDPLSVFFEKRLPTLPQELTTDRLLLRRWRPSDRAPFAALNADPRVMECFPSTATTAESGAMADRIEAHFAEKGFGLWAVEVPGEAAFIGFIGLSTPRFDAPFTPCIEIGWRLAAEHWGHGYAPEGAQAALRFAFDYLQLPEIVAITAVTNHRSRRVMEKLGMTHDPTDDFDHPLLAPGHPITPHVLYRVQNNGSQP